MFQQGWAGVPRRFVSAFGYIAARQCRHRDTSHLACPYLFGKHAEVSLDLVKRGLIVTDQVHLVDRQHEMADAEERGDIGMAPGLGQDALCGVDQ